MTLRPRRWNKWLRRLVCCLLLLGGLLAAAMLFLPWSPLFLRAYLEGVLAERLDCPVSIERVTIHLWRGELRIERLLFDYSAFADRFQSCGVSRPVWEMSHAVVAVKWRDVLSRRRLTSITVFMRDLDAVVVAFAQNRPVCFPPIPDWIRAQPKARSSRPWIYLHVENAALHVRGPSQVASEPADFLFSQINCRASLNPRSLLSDATLSGRLGQSRLSSFQFALTASPRWYNVQLRTSPIRFGDPGVGPRSWSGRTDTIRLNAQFGCEPTNRWSGVLTGSCPHIEALGMVETATSLSATGAFDPSTSHGTVALYLTSRDSQIRGGAAVCLNGFHDSAATITVERLADGWLHLWNARRRPQWPAIEGHPKHLAIEATARLTTPPLQFRQPRVRLALSGVSLSSDYLPFPVADIDFEGSAAPDRIAIARCRGEWANGRLSLCGSHEGRWWGGWEGTSRILWDFALKAEDFLTTLPAPLEAKATTPVLAALSRRPLVSGDLSGSGTLVLGWERAGSQGVLTTQTLEGTIVFRDGCIEHPLLPAPVTGVHGRFALSPQRLEIQSARAAMAGTSASVIAAVEGEPFFWSNPHAQCTIQTEIPITEALRFAPDSLRPRLAAVEPRGHVSAVLALSGPLRRSIQAEDIAASGTVLFRNVAFQSPLWALEGTFHDISGRLELTESMVRLTTATGWIGDVPLAVEAEAQPQAGRFWARAETTADFPALQQIMPRALSRYEVGGTLSARFELDAFGKDLFRQAFGLKDLTSETLLYLPFQWGLRGEVHAHDCQLTLETFPTSLTGINGLITMKNFDWTFEDVTSSWGKTDQCRLRGGGSFRPGNWPVMHLELEAPVLYLDEWIRPWRRSRGARFPPRMANPVFEMTGTLRGKRAIYRGHPGENFYGEFTLISPYATTDVFHFENTSVDLYGGKLLGKGDILFKRGASTCTLELEARDISLPPLLQCESGREQTFIGRLTGRSTFRWLNGDGNTLTGKGDLTIAESKFFGNVFFRNLGRLIRIPILDDISFATIEAPFRIANNRVTTDHFTMDGPFLSVSGEGTVGFDHSLDFLIELTFPHLPNYIWPLDLVFRLVSKVPATALWLNLRGTWDDPEYSFHHFDAAEQVLLSLVEFLWSTVTPE